MSPGRALAFLVPGPLGQRTGGYLYDAQIVDGLRARGWRVDVHELEGTFPFPSPAALDQASRVLGSLAARMPVVIDGLAFGALSEAVCECARGPIIALVHHPLALETGLTPHQAGMLEAGERRTLTHARHVVVTSAETAATLGAYGVDASRVTVVEPGTAPAMPARGSSDGVVRLLCVATLTPRKGHDILIRALARVPSRAWRLTCVGSGDHHGETARALDQLVAGLELHACVTFVGEAGPGEVDAYYDRADVFVLPTRYEGYGMAVAEALAHGLPVISTPTGHIAALVGDDAGMLVLPGDVSALTDALRRVIEEPETRRRWAAGAGRARLRLPTWDAAVGAFERVLQDASS